MLVVIDKGMNMWALYNLFQIVGLIVACAALVMIMKPWSVE